VEYVSEDPTEKPGFMLMHKSDQGKTEPQTFGIYVDLELMQCHIGASDAADADSDAMFMFTVADIAARFIEDNEQGIGGPLDDDDGSVSAMIAALRSAADRLEERKNAEA
jgi:hypothetical protein